MSSSANKEKKLKYLGIQFITIDDPILEQSRLSLGAQRSNQSHSRLSIKASANNIDSLKPYPGLENSSELFTHDEISEINYSMSLGSNSKNMPRFKPTSRLSLLKQVSQTIQEKKDYNNSLSPKDLNDQEFLDKDKKESFLHPLNVPSTPLTRCDSLISSRNDDANFLQGNDSKYSENLLNDDQSDSYFNAERQKEEHNSILTHDEIENQIWLYAHDTASSNTLDNLEESTTKTLTARSLPAKIVQSRQIEGKKENCANKDKINESSTINNSNDEKNNNSTNAYINGNIDAIVNTNDNMKNSNDYNNNNNTKINNNRSLSKNSNHQTKKRNQINFAFQNRNCIQPINGSIENGRTNITLNKGEKRLKNIIAMSAPKETVTPEFNTPSILKKSYCARCVSKFLQNTSAPLPTFLLEDSEDN
ncbi:hypothetical protein M9Y10_042466 [Tritrichomonas musculus]|uniref:Uncharacterized protein n=1 Tax=Tritrichomonas musculus TaxID=1915356 RepID=A0ABR2GQR3_9EUKA